MSIAQNVADRARSRGAKPLQLTTSSTPVGVPLSAISEGSSANASSEMVSNELPSLEPASPNPRILIPDHEVSTLSGHVSGSEYKSGDPADQIVSGDDPLPFGVDLVAGIYLFKLEHLGRWLVKFNSGPDIESCEAVYEEANISNKSNRFQIALRAEQGAPFLDYPDKTVLVNDQPVFVRGLVVIGEKQFYLTEIDGGNLILIGKNNDCLPIYDRPVNGSGNQFYNDKVIQAAAGHPDYITLLDHTELRNELRGKVGVSAFNIIRDWFAEREQNFIDNSSSSGTGQTSGNRSSVVKSTNSSSNVSSSFQTPLSNSSSKHVPTALKIHQPVLDSVQPLDEDSPYDESTMLAVAAQVAGRKELSDLPKNSKRRFESLEKVLNVAMAQEGSRKYRYNEAFARRILGQQVFDKAKDIDNFMSDENIREHYRWDEFAGSDSDVTNHDPVLSFTNNIRSVQNKVAFRDIETSQSYQSSTIKSSGRGNPTSGRGNPASGRGITRVPASVPEPIEIDSSLLPDLLEACDYVAGLPKTNDTGIVKDFRNSYSVTSSDFLQEGDFIVAIFNKPLGKFTATDAAYLNKTVYRVSTLSDDGAQLDTIRHEMDINRSVIFPDFALVTVFPVKVLVLKPSLKRAFIDSGLDEFILPQRDSSSGPGSGSTGSGRGSSAGGRLPSTGAGLRNNANTGSFINSSSTDNVSGSNRSNVEDAKNYITDQDGKSFYVTINRSLKEKLILCTLSLRRVCDVFHLELFLSDNHYEYNPDSVWFSLVSKATSIMDSSHLHLSIPNEWESLRRFNILSDIPVMKCRNMFIYFLTNGMCFSGSVPELTLEYFVCKFNSKSYDDLVESIRNWESIMVLLWNNRFQGCFNNLLSYCLNLDPDNVEYCVWSIEVKILRQFFNYMSSTTYPEAYDLSSADNENGCFKLLNDLVDSVIHDDNLSAFASFTKSGRRPTLILSVFSSIGSDSGSVVAGSSLHNLKKVEKPATVEKKIAKKVIREDSIESDIEIDPKTSVLEQICMKDLAYYIYNKGFKDIRDKDTPNGPPKGCLVGANKCSRWHHGKYGKFSPERIYYRVESSLAPNQFAAFKDALIDKQLKND